MAQLAQKRKKSRAAAIAYIIHGILKIAPSFSRKEPPTAPDCALRNVHNIILANTHTSVGVLSRGANLFE